MIRHEIENHIVALPTLCEILMGVIDNVVCTDVREPAEPRVTLRILCVRWAMTASAVAALRA